MKRNKQADPEYGPKTADDLRIEKLVGTFGDGCVAAYIDVPGLFYTQAFRTERYGAHTITFRSGQACDAFYQNKIYSIDILDTQKSDKGKTEQALFCNRSFFSVKCIFWRYSILTFLLFCGIIMIP